ncbi:LPXTG cell wall anchor domain-containing protein [Carnobacterium maltaromaticum]|uniref:LPXTG cell wall anchor domain-containing protein n=1 Tax=Carnobacterium maltaromaticum TaxID=2751 RepID=UPI00295E8F37|nr:LPXTG cell wall anchor domain-containing protein [Carnobacterium maltaromaticum]
MKIIKHVLFWGLSLCLFLNFSITSLATTTTSQVGISFTDKEEVENEDSTIQKSIKLPNTGGDRTSSEFPQTGEYHNPSLLIIGLIILIASRVIKNYTQDKEKET